jgi:pimeloyl-ACP methyl ester carboxylesterase
LPITKSFANTPEDYWERLACFAHVEEVMINNCGHNLHHDQPQQQARQLGDFLAAVR